MADENGKLAIVTGASTGIGYYLAHECARHGYDLIIAADEGRIEKAAANLRADGIDVHPVECDLATTQGAEQLYGATAERPVDLLLANAGRGLGGDFLDQDFSQTRHVIDTNITGTLYLIHKVGRDMRSRGEGRILITGSIAGFTPGSYQAVYSGSKAFLNSFSFALRTELQDAGVSVTCLMPGVTETEFFARADMLDTEIGTSQKDYPAEVARVGFEAMMRGDGDIVSGWKNKLQTMFANVMPAGTLAEQHKRRAAPGTGRK